MTSASLPPSSRHLWKLTLPRRELSKKQESSTPVMPQP
ncbi:hypothetical protein CLIM01_13459 [Colletotrichum limetticola]|uniref:Uncharacterized protein n=1 Tax=Colletotrichum limetticola TaxID=1209924 RepID=A0ABQ9PAU6_9PEZI|nr:hypothetical protein CLIM01_13459 [Colletotrichum limetticola]